MNTWKAISIKRLSIRLAENWLYSAKNFHKRYSIELPDHLIIFKDEVAYGYLDQAQFDKCRKKLISKLYSSTFFELYEKDAVGIMKSFLAYCEKLSRKDFKNISNEMLIKNWKEFLRNEDEWMSTAWLIFILDEPLTDELKNKLKEKKFMKAILTKTKKTDMIKQRLDLLYSALSGNHNNLAEKYAHFPILNMDESPLTNDYFINEIKKVKNPVEKIIKIHTNFDKNVNEYERVLKYFSSDKEMTKLIEACNKVVFYRDYRNDVRQRCYYHARKLYFEIASRLNIDIKDVIYLERKEIEDSLKNNELILSLELIKKRKKNSLLTSIKSKIKSDYNINKIKKLSKEIIGNQIKKIKGIPANPGTVKGIAKIVVDIKKDKSKFEEGDILVTTTTNLEYLELIHKASAIITDIGGTLCHAAITAREFNKPCIVGAKNATKVLKDKDYIIVNANNGTIRKI
ncbi:MAG: hypothetical protein KKF89_03510 [Nanoarchaeota archaeon]|nr:hypothetical protein [Nanoarchaeota archaeon]MBU1854763.1 hypothetical protein [Nanoarchaeota archaeon]